MPLILSGAGARAQSWPKTDRLRNTRDNQPVQEGADDWPYGRMSRMVASRAAPAVPARGTASNKQQNQPDL